ncbi:MAG: rhodanese-like domain-containing protein [Bythopirellula sp.]|nr:rhodanese-like domain-containing protein [Bythopirellula sp.]
MALQLGLLTLPTFGADIENVGLSVKEQLPRESPNSQVDTVGSLCGVYAACTALKMIGFDAEPRDFFAARYVGKCGGSTPEEVARVITAAGGKAQIVSRLSSFDLGQVDCPVIANIRSTPTEKQFNHWVVAIKDKDGVIIFDGTNQESRLLTAEFLGVWSGLGILVSREGENPLLSVWLGRLAVLQIALIGCGLVGSFPSFRINLNRLRSSNQVLLIVAAAALLAGLGNAVMADPENHLRGVVVATSAHAANGFRLGTLAEAEDASKDSSKLLIDARRERDFEAGSLLGAINIPVSASQWSIRDYLENVGRETPIVVFCQSSRCGYDEAVATNLVNLGFQNVTVCDEGWYEYQMKQESQATHGQSASQ